MGRSGLPSGRFGSNDFPRLASYGPAGQQLKDTSPKGAAVEGNHPDQHSKLIAAAVAPVVPKTKGRIGRCHGKS